LVVLPALQPPGQVSRVVRRRGGSTSRIDLRVHDVLLMRDGLRILVTKVAMLHAKMKICNLQLSELENYAVGHTGILVQNSSGTPQGQWQWTPSRTTPLLPRRGGTAPAGGHPRTHPTYPTDPRTRRNDFGG
jgi:hypothetical protein